MFLIRDPAKFPSLVHATKRDPKTNLASADMVCDSGPYELMLFANKNVVLGVCVLNSYIYPFQCIG